MHELYVFMHWFASLVPVELDCAAEELWVVLVVVTWATVEDGTKVETIADEDDTDVATAAREVTDVLASEDAGTLVELAETLPVAPDAAVEEAPEAAVDEAAADPPVQRAGPGMV